MQNKIINFYQSHDRKESMLLSMIYAYISMLTLFCIISLWVELHPEFHILVSIISYIDNMTITFIILFIGIFYQLITESSYQKLQKANEEKEQLLKIIHHKIRNNLNFISSLLGLQIRHIKKHPNQDNIDTLKSAKSRIQSIALSHRALYNTKDMVHVDSKIYIQNLFIFVNERYKKDIKLICKTGDIFFLEKTTHNLGLILNELFHKSLKNSNKKRDVTIELSKHDDKYLFVYHDKDADIKLQKESFSYKLINLIANQLEADTMILSADRGLSCKMWFRV